VYTHYVYIKRNERERENWRDNDGKIATTLFRMFRYFFFIISELITKEKGEKKQLKTQSSSSLAVMRSRGEWLNHDGGRL
jgi:hypothetical protein